MDASGKTIVSYRSPCANNTSPAEKKAPGKMQAARDEGEPAVISH